MRKPSSLQNALGLLILVTLVMAACQSTPTPTPPQPTTIPPTVAPTTAPTTVPTAAPTAAPTTAPTAAPSGEEPIYLALVWHQHQPLYYKDADGVYTRPWARLTPPRTTTTWRYTGRLSERPCDVQPDAGAHPPARRPGWWCQGLLLGTERDPCGQLTMNRSSSS